MDVFHQSQGLSSASKLLYDGQHDSVLSRGVRGIHGFSASMSSDPFDASLSLQTLGHPDDADYKARKLLMDDDIASKQYPTDLLLSM